ncbi:MAG: HD domain-containing protein [Solirubrobacteraceae bacterium]
MSGVPVLGARFTAAIELAGEIHGEQRRRGTEIPFMAHLLVVTGLVLEDGGDEDEAIAALLHDAVEDGGGRAMLELIEEHYGERVAAIVEGCSDTIDVEKSQESWLSRKRRYLEHLPRVEDDGILRVSLADKVHNARSLARDWRAQGATLWERLSEKTAGEQLWYYRHLLTFFEQHRPGPMTIDLREAVEELQGLVALDVAARGLFAAHELEILDPPVD